MQSANRVWITLNSSNALTDVNKVDLRNAGFFANALKNAAFRISYNLADDNVSALTLEEVGSHTPAQYKLTNFTTIAGDSCSASFTGNGTVSSNCGSNGSGQGSNGMDPSELAACMECIYGKNTKKVCSRDNFSIRPEAFEFTLFDYNQTDQTTKQSFLINTSNTSTSKTTDLASGYKYIVEANATDHYNNQITKFSIGFSFSR